MQARRFFSNILYNRLVTYFHTCLDALHNMFFYSRVKKEQSETDFTASVGPSTPITQIVPDLCESLVQISAQIATAAATHLYTNSNALPYINNNISRAGNSFFQLKTFFLCGFTNDGKLYSNSFSMQFISLMYYPYVAACHNICRLKA